METWGNTDILNLPKTAFLRSRKCPANVVLKSYDWAKEQREAENCIVCGNHSQIEKDVFDILLKGKQPLILVLARGMKTRWEPEIERAVMQNRLLVISPFDKTVKRVTRETAEGRNRIILEISDRIIVGYKTRGGQLDKLLIGKHYEDVWQVKSP
ncbi:MAG: hypothetical protein Kow00127_20220 [Bacteroidales bacterium]